jgi:hypothetical protein
MTERSAELILKQPDGKTKRLVIKTDCLGMTTEEIKLTDIRMIKSVLDSMSDDRFRASLIDVTSSLRVMENRHKMEKG